MKIVNVAVGVIKRDDAIFISKRADRLHQGGKWEFPGGKIEADETPLQALTRELQEEVGIQVQQATDFMLVEHDYGDKQVRLHIQLVEGFTGEPKHLEGQQAEWVAMSELPRYEFPEANVAIVQKLLNTHF